MKVLKAVPKIVLSALSALSINMAYAGRDGGGGNAIITLTSQEQVSDAINNSKEDLVHLLKLWSYGRFENKKIQDADVVKVLEKLFAGGIRDADGKVKNLALENDLDSTPIIKSLKQNCKNPHDERTDASVEQLRIGSAICFDVNSLRIISDQFLQAQVTALLAHEVAHQFGFEENTAVKFQNYVFSTSINPTNSKFPHSGVNLTIMTPKNFSVGTVNGIIELRGLDAKAVYDSMNVAGTHSEHNDFFPPGTDKTGNEIHCTKYDSPIPDNSPFAIALKAKKQVNVIIYDYKCSLFINSELGTVSPYPYR